VTSLSVAESPVVVDQALGERTNLRERLVRLLGREVALRHPSIILGVVSAGQRVRQARAPAEDLELRRVRNPALEIFVWSRLAIWGAAVLAFAWFEPNRHPDADRWDTPFLHELGWLTDVWARWDSGFFLQIAEHGYSDNPEQSPAFFPLYPGLVAGLGRLLAGHYILAGIAVSLAAALGAFLLLFRLAEARLGVDGARRTVLYLALFPMALFLQAVYSEALFLLLAVAAFLLAERGRWLAAAGAAGLALLTRSAGLALLPALAVLAWRAPDRRRALGSLALAPGLFAVYPLLLWVQIGDPLAFVDAQGIWHRSFSPAGPLGGIWEGVKAVVTGDVPPGAGAQHAHAVNIQGLVFLALFLVLTVVAWRRFGAPYGLFAALSLAIPLSAPSERWPLLSLPRFGLVVFPFFLALAVLGGRPRVHAAIVGISALFLGVAVVQWALWQWVA
jgi:Mannosyltransferase (PIG-V)